MPKKKTPASKKKTAKKTVRKKKKVVKAAPGAPPPPPPPASVSLPEHQPRPIGGDIEPLPGEVKPVYPKDWPAPTQAKEEPAEEKPDLATPALAKVEEAVKQANSVLKAEMFRATALMQERIAKGGRELELVATQEPGYMAYVLTAEVARTINRVRPDIRCKNLLDLVEALP